MLGSLTMNLRLPPAVHDARVRAALAERREPRAEAEALIIRGLRWQGLLREPDDAVRGEPAREGTA